MSNISALKFKTPSGIIYVTTGKQFLDCVTLANRICKPDDREYLGSYIQGDNNCDAWFRFLSKVDVVTNI